MVWQTCYLFHLPINSSLLGFTFFGTLCSYNFHWYFTPAAFGGSNKTAWSGRNKPVHATLFLIALVGALYCTWLLRAHWGWLLLTAFVTFLYSAPKVPHNWALHLQKIAVGKTIFLAFAWAHVTALLPLLVYNADQSDKAVFFVVNRFFLIYAICILFDYRDRESDRKEGIRSLLTWLEHEGILILFWTIMVAFGLSGILLYGQGMPLVSVVALSIPGLIVAGLQPYSMRHSGDYHYYFVLDGLMAFSVPLVALLDYGP
ncbi:UbiA prenyltransferase family protein [Cnuella takakiae]|uniref:UbiA prenyltransferase family protein n=2 Tax=Cnuella takakiae TaxID=1302690 RepID=A0A1M4UUS0_9BACT|nr:UbiA prenyltransferase family protein [Cnuella takakiae]